MTFDPNDGASLFSLRSEWMMTEGDQTLVEIVESVGWETRDGQVQTFPLIDLPHNQLSH
jgi:hypothetical protein